VEAGDPLALVREYRYYDPIYMLPAEGQQWWRSQHAAGPRQSDPVPA
jgi:lysine 2,3-aminomutase